MRGQQRKVTGNSLSLMVKLEDTPQPQPILLLKKKMAAGPARVIWRLVGVSWRGKCLFRLLKAPKVC